MKEIKIVCIAFMLLSSTLLFFVPAVAEDGDKFDGVVDLDIDSDNNNGVSFPERTDLEDSLENFQGKEILINSDDDDGNLMPDKYQEGNIPQEDDLVPLILEIGLTREHGDLPVPKIVNYTLTYSSHIRVWDSQQRDDEVLTDIWNKWEIALLGDMNRDGAVNGFDIDPFMDALNNPDDFQIWWNENGSIYHNFPAVGDMNGDGNFDEDDTPIFVDYLVHGPQLPVLYVPIRFWVEGNGISSQNIGISASVDFSLGYDVANDTDSVLVKVVENPDEVPKPQLVISAPSLVSEGEPFDVTINANNDPIEDVKVTFNDIIFYAGPDGKVSPTAPLVDTDTDYIIIASKSGYNDDSKTVTVQNILEPSQLTITAPNTATMGELFTVTVTVRDIGTPVEDAAVTFNEETKITDNTGAVTFTAPVITEHTEFTISVQHNDYEPVTTTITVLYQEIHGSLNGIVYKGDGSSLAKATVCVILSSAENTITSTCTLTNTTGSYNFKHIPVGTYTVKAKKKGYTTNTYQVTITEDDLQQTLNFVLIESTVSKPENINKQLLDAAIDDAIEDATLGGQIFFATQQEINIYRSELNITIGEATKQEKSITVVAPEGTQPAILAIHIQNTEISTIEVSCDGEPVQRGTLDVILNPEGNKTLYAIISTGENDVHILLVVPHFSEHTITISSLVGGIEVLIFYIAFCIVAALAFIVHIISGPIIRYIAKRKR